MKVYNLYIYLENMVSSDIYSMYKNAVENHNKKIDEYIYYINSGEKNGVLEPSYDAGFDLFCPNDITVNNISSMYEINHKIVTAMKLDNRYVSYYLYSRSSTPKKTDLRLANSVGIIDSGYRGNIIANFDNMKYYQEENEYNCLNKRISIGDRLVQICPPNIEYPMKIYLVDKIEDLGKTERGTGGFGSTGS
tara:strand:- start:693 stop:1268 length:576 start_codon:yes stop_codon:yes gene_type:complete